MNKKSIIKIILLMVIGGIFGFIISLSVLALNDTGAFPVFISCSMMLAILASYSYFSIYKN